MGLCRKNKKTKGTIAPKKSEAHVRHGRNPQQIPRSRCHSRRIAAHRKRSGLWPSSSDAQRRGAKVSDTAPVGTTDARTSPGERKALVTIAEGVSGVTDASDEKIPAY